MVIFGTVYMTKYCSYTLEDQREKHLRGDPEYFSTLYFYIKKKKSFMLNYFLMCYRNEHEIKTCNEKVKFQINVLA